MFGKNFRSLTVVIFTTILLNTSLSLAYEYWIPHVDLTRGRSGGGMLLRLLSLSETTLDLDYDHDDEIDDSFNLERGVPLKLSSDSLDLAAGTVIYSDALISIIAAKYHHDFGDYDDGSYDYEVMPSEFYGDDYWVLGPAGVIDIISINDDCEVTIDEDFNGEPEDEFVLDRGETQTIENLDGALHIQASDNIGIVCSNHNEGYTGNTYAYTVPPVEYIGAAYFVPDEHPYQYLNQEHQSRLRLLATRNETVVQVGDEEFDLDMGDILTMQIDTSITVSSDNPVACLFISDIYAEDIWRRGTYRHWTYAYQLWNLEGVDLPNDYILWGPGREQHVHPGVVWAITSLDNENRIDLDVGADGEVDSTSIIDAGESLYLDELTFDWDAYEPLHLKTTGNTQIVKTWRGSWNDYHENAAASLIFPVDFEEAEDEGIYTVAVYGETAGLDLERHSEVFNTRIFIPSWNGAVFNDSLDVFLDPEIDLIMIGGDDQFSQETAEAIEDAVFNDGKVLCINFWSDSRFNESLPCDKIRDANYGPAIFAPDTVNSIVQKILEGVPRYFERDAPNWNRRFTSLKEGATEVFRFELDNSPALAVWEYGNGKVIYYTFEVIGAFIPEPYLDLVCYQAVMWALGYEQILFEDNFEDYEVGDFPQPPWIPDGNANNDGAVDDAVSHSESNSLKLGGVVGGNWGALAIRPFLQEDEVVGDNPLRFEVWVYNDSTAIPDQGHQFRSKVQLFTAPTWREPHHSMIGFHKNGTILAANGSVIGNYNTLQWYQVVINFIHSDDSLSFEYHLNGEEIGTVAIESEDFDNRIRFLSLDAPAGRAWFDDVRVSDTPHNHNIDEEKHLPLTFEFIPPYPNPFNSQVKLSFTLNKPDHIRLSIFDITGREVALLAEDRQISGGHTISWDASGFPSGVYFARLITPQASKTVKMVLVR